MQQVWKDNIEDAMRNHEAWWWRRGLVINAGAVRRDAPRVEVPEPIPPPTAHERAADAPYRAAATLHAMAWHDFPWDAMPLANCDFGPGNLATFLGSEPEIRPETVWFHPCIEDPESHGPLRFDPEGRWWRIQKDVIERQAAAAEGRYFVCCPDLVENFDVLASLRRNDRLLLDLYERPEWVKARIGEINEAFFEAYDRIHAAVGADRMGATFNAFHLWAPGRMAKVQCDESALISPDQFEEFVVPALAEQCRRLEFSMFHLDGSHCIRHLDALLAIEDLNAVEFTPEPGRPPGGDPHWHPLYRRILNAGKGVQILSVDLQQAHDILEALGGAGVYMCLTGAPGEADARALEKAARPWRA